MSSASTPRFHAPRGNEFKNLRPFERGKMIIVLRSGDAALVLGWPAVVTTVDVCGDRTLR